MTKEELVKMIIDNFIDENGDIDLRGLDFSGINGDVMIGGMKVPNSLYQDHQRAESHLYQCNQNVGGDLHQQMQIVGGDLKQYGRYVEGNIYE